MGKHCKGWFQRCCELRQRAASRAKARQSRVVLTVEVLEDRITPAVYNVNTTADIAFTAAQVNNATGEIGTTGLVTLRSAIEASNATVGPNTINLTVPGTYQIQLPGTAGEHNNLAGEFAITGNSVTILDTSGSPVVIDGGTGNSRVFEIGPNGASDNNLYVTIGSLTGPSITIQHGNGDAGNAASPGGGGILVGNGGGTPNTSNLTLNDVIVTNNSALLNGENGGGIDLVGGGVLTLNDSTVSNNVATSGNGGGIGMEGPGTGGSVIVNDSTITENAANFGGGIGLNNGRGGTPLVTITDSVLSSNAALTSGGGISTTVAADITVTGSVVSGNKALGGDGGGIRDQSGGGAAIAVNTSEVTGNVALDNGGGVFMADASGILSIQRSTVDTNTAQTGSGGGVDVVNDSGTAGNMLVNDTITGNLTGLNGGGVNVGGGTLALVSDTINGNTVTGAGSTGGGVTSNGTAGGLTVTDTIIAGNTVNGGATGPDIGGTTAFTSQGGNLIGNPTGGTFTPLPSDQVGTAANPINPHLAGLANNGGPLIGLPSAAFILPTEAELPNSTAIDAGVPAAGDTTDERGFPRPDNIGTEGSNPDIGAFERQDAGLSVTVAPSSSTVLVGNSVTFTTTVANTSTTALPADNSTVSVTVPSGLTITSVSAGGTVSGNVVTFSLGALASGASTSFTVTARATTAGAATITAAVTSPDTDPNPGSTTIDVVSPTPAPTPTPTPAPATTVNISSIQDTYTFFSQVETVEVQVNFNNNSTPVTIGSVTISDGGQTQTVGLNSTGDAFATFVFPFVSENPFAHPITASYSDNAGGTLFASSSGTGQASDTTTQFYFQLLFDALLLGL
jgi:hypothetical protein